jgi:hypothetical protein
MSRVVLVALLLAPTVASAQDMPLFTFTKPGEGWVKADGKKPDAGFAEERGESLKGGQKNSHLVIGGERYAITYFNSIPLMEPKKPDGKLDLSDIPHPQSERIAAAVRTADKETVYVGFSHETAVWAFTPDEAGKLTNGAPYAPLRVRKGYDNSKAVFDKQKANPPLTAVTALSLDSAGRLYAATEQDLQVFDPTGRLSGVLTLPEKGKVESIAWEGKEKDTLAVWVGEQKWTRKMNPSGR